MKIAAKKALQNEKKVRFMKIIREFLRYSISVQSIRTEGGIIHHTNVRHNGKIKQFEEDQRFDVRGKNDIILSEVLDYIYKLKQHRIYYIDTWTPHISRISSVLSYILKIFQVQRSKGKLNPKFIWPSRFINIEGFQKFKQFGDLTWQEYVSIKILRCYTKLFNKAQKSNIKININQYKKFDVYLEEPHIEFSTLFNNEIKFNNKSQHYISADGVHKTRFSKKFIGKLEKIKQTFMRKKLFKPAKILFLYWFFEKGTLKKLHIKEEMKQFNHFINSIWNKTESKKRKRNALSNNIMGRSFFKIENEEDFEFLRERYSYERKKKRKIIFNVQQRNPYEPPKKRVRYNNRKTPITAVPKIQLNTWGKKKKKKKRKSRAKVKFTQIPSNLTNPF